MGTSHLYWRFHLFPRHARREYLSSGGGADSWSTDWEDTLSFSTGWAQIWPRFYANHHGCVFTWWKPHYQCGSANWSQKGASQTEPLLPKRSGCKHHSHGSQISGLTRKHPHLHLHLWPFQQEFSPLYLSVQLRRGSPAQTKGRLPPHLFKHQGYRAFSPWPEVTSILSLFAEGCGGIWLNANHLRQHHLTEK